MSELVLVVGAGTMGSGIAQLAAQSGRDVLLVDVDADLLTRATDRMKQSLDKLAAKGKLEESAAAVAARVRTHADPEGSPPPLGERQGQNRLWLA